MFQGISWYPANPISTSGKSTRSCSPVLLYTKPLPIFSTLGVNGPNNWSSNKIEGISSAAVVPVNENPRFGFVKLARESPPSGWVSEGCWFLERDSSSDLLCVVSVRLSTLRLGESALSSAITLGPRRAHSFLSISLYLQQTWKLVDATESRAAANPCTNVATSFLCSSPEYALENTAL